MQSQSELTQGEIEYIAFTLAQSAESQEEQAQGLTSMERMSEIMTSVREEDNYSQSIDDMTPEQQSTFDPYAAGLKNPSWLAYLEEFGSRDKYEKRVLDFKLWCHTKMWEANYPERSKLLDYFIYSHGLKKTDGSPLYAPTSLRGWTSMFLKFFKYVHNENIKETLPLLHDKLTAWEKEYTVTKSKVFSEEDVEALYDLPCIYTNVGKKCYAAIALHFAARGVEMLPFSFMDVKRIMHDGRPAYEIHYKRAKLVGTRSSDGQFALVLNAKAVRCIDEYIECFKMGERTGRFFRKINKHMRATYQVIGKETAKDYAKCLAQLLGHPDFALFSGHAFRRSAITIMAGFGCSMSEIQSLSGHRSSSVVQEYIDSSPRMKRTVATALSGCEESPSKVPKIEAAATAPLTVSPMRTPFDSSWAAPMPTQVMQSPNIFNITINGGNNNVGYPTQTGQYAPHNPSMCTTPTLPDVGCRQEDVAILLEEAQETDADFSLTQTVDNMIAEMYEI